MDFFVAYHAADQNWAEWVGQKLQKAGKTVELQSYDYWARSSMILEMFAVSAIADATIALLSPEFLVENLDRPEWQAAHARTPPLPWAYCCRCACGSATWTERCRA